jgi:hypothetical protein
MRGRRVPSRVQVDPDSVPVRVVTRGGRAYPGMLMPSPCGGPPLVVVDGEPYAPGDEIGGDVIRGVVADAEYLDSALVMDFNREAAR